MTPALRMTIGGLTACAALNVACGALLGADFEDLRPRRAEVPEGLPDAGVAVADADAGADAGAVADADAGAEPRPDGSLDATGSLDAVPPAAAIAHDYYVDAAAITDGDGTPATPFRTITSALSAAARDAQAGLAGPKRVHVARGTYDAALGEVFPLVVRGVSIDGAGEAETIVAGSGAYSVTQGSLRGSTVLGALVVGDTEGATSLSNFTVRDPAPVDGGGPAHVGVLCDRGSTAAAGATPNTAIHAVTLDGYGQSLWLATSNGPSGCAVTVTSSTFANAGAGISTPGDCARVPAIVAEIGAASAGDGGSAVDTFQNVRAGAADASGAAIDLGSCVLRADVQGNVFEGSDVGLRYALPATDAPGQVSVTDNDFHGLAVSGVLLVGGASLEELDRNSFANISAQNAPVPQIGALGAGVVFAHDPSDEMSLPRVVRARGNRFFGNNCAVQIGAGVLSASSDFGTPLDPGGNVFQCNSAPTIWASLGGDVRVYATADPADGGALLFAGNTWDHAPPTVVYGMPAGTKNGTDVELFSSTPPPIDTSGATAPPPSCAPGQVP